MQAHLSNLYLNMLLHAVPVKAALDQETALTVDAFTCFPQQLKRLKSVKGEVKQMRC